MKRFIQLGFACILLAPLVFGDVRTFSWTAPTEYEDGARLDNTDIKEYHLHCNSGLEVIISNTPRTDGWVSEDTDFPPGTYECWMHTTTTMDIHSLDSNRDRFTMTFEVTPTSGSGCS